MENMKGQYRTPQQVVYYTREIIIFFNDIVTVKLRGTFAVRRDRDWTSSNDILKSERFRAVMA